MNHKLLRVLRDIGVAGTMAMASLSSSALEFTDPDQLSANDSAAKTKLVRMGNGWLVSVFGDAAGPDVYDTKGDKVRPARDIFARACNTNTSESNCASEEDWTEPANLSNTALLTSISTDWNPDLGNPGVAPFYGDSDKPNIFVSGSFAVVTWVDKYCEGGDQRMVQYIERGGVTVPFSCLYVSYTNNAASGSWTTEQITDGLRDAKSDANKGLSVGTPAVGNWAISWQEDPHGLQLGGAEGPGHGASGAKVTHGTDVWYTFSQDLMSGSWAAPVRVTDNYTMNSSAGNADPVYHPSDLENEVEDLERGTAGAARPNLMLVGGSNPPTAVIAYEENKSADRTDSGKFIRYHNFAFNNPPASAGQYESGEPGCIISDPLENSRRVRFVAQPNASTNGLRMGVFWRQGLPTEGGPADIMVRLGTTAGGGSGLNPEDMVPAVDPDCRTSVYAEASELAHDPASNISSNTVPWSPYSCEAPLPVEPGNMLSDSTSFNPYEDARAHRGAIVGDDLHVGYSYAKDWAIANYTDMDNYNFFVRKFNVVGAGTWTESANVSNIMDPAINVKEPRLVKTPGNGPGCQDPDNITNPENCQDKSTYIVAWGTETNVYSHAQESEELDIYYTRTRDKGATFEDAVVIPGIGGNHRFESQLRPTPAGNVVYAVWNEADGVGTHAKISVSDESSDDPVESYVSIDSFKPWSMISTGTVGKVVLFASNSVDNPDVEFGTVIVEGSDGTHIEKGFWNLLPGVTRRILRADWTAPDTPQVVTWTARLIVDGEVVDEATAETTVF